MGDITKGEQSYDAQRTDINAGEIGSDTNEVQEEADRLFFANSCRSYFMFRLAEDPV